MENQEIITKLRVMKNKFISNLCQILKRYNLTRMEFDILNCIYFSSLENKQIKASSLAKYFEVSIPAVMHKLDALEARKMVVKTTDAMDKRVKYYTLTKETKNELEELFQHRKHQGELFFQSLGEEKEHLSRILDITLKFLEDDYD
ncbi:MAG: MarR family transcriptional regulator [Roseburia sp.]|nr:MarR family transcriptional regulator [Anaeroplasma bactoclasticum]MCM1196342.1 MarR family transcriptional regulator [Roseburia sp.]MCM1556481.1 MarR family transcriptional regulator [Anaeroplasma bactoclasticum]